MFRNDLFKQHFTTLVPKIRELWPNLTEQEVKAINGDVDILVKTVKPKYQIEREEILNRLAPFLPTEVGVAGASGKSSR